MHERIVSHRTDAVAIPLLLVAGHLHYVSAPRNRAKRQAVTERATWPRTRLHGKINLQIFLAVTLKKCPPKADFMTILS